MSVINGTYKQLLEIRADIKKQCAASSAFSLFNRGKIDRFYSYNKQRLDIADTTVGKLVNKHVVFEDDKPKMEMVNDVQYFVFKSEDDKTIFNAAYAEFSSIIIPIEF